MGDPRPERSPATTRQVLGLWAPMAGTWLMMAAEAPFLAAIIARAPEPKYNLAAFGVAYAVAILVEAPVIMILSAATALVEGPLSLHRLRRFTGWLNLAVTAAMALLAATGLWTLAAKAMDLDAEVATLTRGALLLMLPWPAAIGYRRFRQGLLIRDGRTRLVAYGTVLRIAAMAAVAVALFRTSMHGAWVGAAALSAGVCVEALAARAMSREAVRRIVALPPTDSDGAVTYGAITRFYFPLALTSMIALTAQPMTTFFVGHSRMALESLAVLPVVHALSFLFRSVGLSYQEVAIALLGKGRENVGPIVRVAWILAVASSLGQAAIAFTPLAGLWLRELSGLTAELARFALPPIRILAIAPALSVLQALQRALLVQSRRTAAITWGTVVEIAALLAGLALTVHGFAMVGATAAALAFVLGRVAGNVYLTPPCLRVVRGSGGRRVGWDRREVARG